MTTHQQSLHDDSALGAACIPNISGPERRKRLRSGIISLVLSLGVLALLLAIRADFLWRLALLPLFLGAATGYFQWADKTCVALASRDSRQTGDSPEQITDAGELAQVKRQARTVSLKALAAGALLTLLVMAIPVL